MTLLKKSEIGANALSIFLSIPSAYDKKEYHQYYNFFHFKEFLIVVYQ